MWRNQIGVEGAGSLGDALKTNTSLESLVLRENSLGPVGVEMMVDGLVRMRVRGRVHVICACMHLCGLVCVCVELCGSVYVGMRARVRFFCAFDMLLLFTDVLLLLVCFLMHSVMCCDLCCCWLVRCWCRWL